jgi:hypothetical protein
MTVLGMFVVGNSIRLIPKYFQHLKPFSFCRMFSPTMNQCHSLARSEVVTMTTTRYSQLELKLEMEMKIKMVHGASRCFSEMLRGLLQQQRNVAGIKSQVTPAGDGAAPPPLPWFLSSSFC